MEGIYSAIPFALALLAGAVAGAALRGSAARLAATRLGQARLLVAGLLLQVLTTVPPASRWSDAPRFAVACGGLALVGVFIAVNVRTVRAGGNPGVWLAGAGYGLNALVVVVNGGIPVSVAADQRLHDEVVTPASLDTFWSNPLTSDTTLGFLGDVILVEPLGSILSVGDLLILAGIALFVAWGMVRYDDQSAADAPPAGALIEAPPPATASPSGQMPAATAVVSRPPPPPQAT